MIFLHLVRMHCHSGTYLQVWIQVIDFVLHKAGWQVAVIS